MPLPCPVGLRAGEQAVFGCPSLKRAYRDVLRGEARSDGIRFAYLQGSYDLLRTRLGARTGHFFDASLLQSQLDTLEVPDADEAITVSIELTPEAVVDRLLANLR